MKFSLFIFAASLLVLASPVSAKQAAKKSSKNAIVNGQTQPPPPPTAAEMKSGLAILSKACVKAREKWLFKYPAVKEDTKKTCACVMRAVETKNDHEALETGHVYYSEKEKIDDDPENMWLDFYPKVEQNCVADSNWKIGNGDPANLEQRMKEIQEQMKKSHQ